MCLMKLGAFYFFDETKIGFMNQFHHQTYLYISEDSVGDLHYIKGVCINFKIKNNVIFCDIVLFKPFDEDITHLLFNKCKLSFEPIIYGKRNKVNETHVDYIKSIFIAPAPSIPSI